MKFNRTEEGVTIESDDGQVVTSPENPRRVVFTGDMKGMYLMGGGSTDEAVDALVSFADTKYHARVPFVYDPTENTVMIYANEDSTPKRYRIAKHIESEWSGYLE